MVYIMKGLEDDICVSDNEPVNVSLSILVTFGLLISYLPQVFRIIRYKSSEGISPWFLLFGTVSATCSLFNILILQFHMIKCCRVVPGITCLENTLGIIQLAIQWFMFMLIFALFMSYFPSHRKLAPYIRHLHFNTPPTKWSIEWRNSVGVAVVVLINFIVVATITVLLLLFYGHHDVNWMKMWADFLGVVSMMLVSIQFIPQLYRTCSRKSVGALSIPMMFIQVPLSFIFVYTLATRPGTRWTTWIVFFVSGCLQGILLLMCICWYFRSRRLGHGPFYVGETDQLLGRDGRPLLPDERTTLISKIQRRRSPRPSTSRGSSYSYNSSSAGSVAGTPTRDLTVNNNNNNNYLAVSS